MEFRVQSSEYTVTGQKVVGNGHDRSDSLCRKLYTLCGEELGIVRFSFILIAENSKLKTENSEPAYFITHRHNITYKVMEWYYGRA